MPTTIVNGAGAVLALIRDGRAMTRGALMQHTGLARSTIAQRVDSLLAAGLVVTADGETSTGGRRPERLRFDPSAGIVLVADLGASQSRLALSDLAGDLLAETAYDSNIAAGPEAVLAEVRTRSLALLEASGHPPRAIRGVALGVPGPVALGTGRPVSPPIMPGWDGFPIPGWVREHVADVPVFVDNDVNLMALGEHRARWARVEHLLFVKVGTGIGCGIVVGRRILRGTEGAAGDIGHVQVTDDESVTCRCGNIGCLEAVAGGHALARRLAAAGHPVAHGRDVARLVREGDPDAVRLVRAAGRVLGDALASFVNSFNPRVVVVGGDIGEGHESLLAGVREAVFGRSLPLATRNLRIVPTALGRRAGVAGAAALVVEELLAPAAVDRLCAG